MKTNEAVAPAYFEALQDFTLPANLDGQTQFVRQGEFVKTARASELPDTFFTRYRKPLRSADTPPRLVASSEHSALKSVCHNW